MSGFVYAITHGGMTYFGSSTSISNRRWNQHKSGYKKNIFACNSKIIFLRAELDDELPTYIVLESFDDIEKEELRKIEQWYINNFENVNDSRAFVSEEQREEHHKELTKKWYENNREKRLEKQKEYSKENREKIAERVKAWQEKNREKIAERQKEYYKNNLEKIAEKAKAWQEKNREKIAERTKEYREKNREKINKKQRERTARKNITL
jgi:hypothetical protein